MLASSGASRTLELERLHHGLMISHVMSVKGYRPDGTEMAGPTVALQFRKCPPLKAKFGDSDWTRAGPLVTEHMGDDGNQWSSGGLDQSLSTMPLISTFLVPSHARLMTLPSTYRFHMR